MEIKSADEKLQILTLHELAVNVVYKYFIHNNEVYDFKSLPDPVIFYLIRQCLINDCDPAKSHYTHNCQHLWNLCQKMDIVVWIRLLKCESYRPVMMQFYQKLIDNKYSIGRKITNMFTNMYSDCTKSGRSIDYLKLIKYGLILGTFLSEASWYAESEQILIKAKNLTQKLPKDISFYKVKLECCHRLFHTQTMYFKFDDAAQLIDEIMNLIQTLNEYEEYENYALLFTEFSRFYFFKNDYEESYSWIRKAMRCLHQKTAISTEIHVLRQASKVCVVKRDFANAKYLMHQALARAEQYYGSGYYKLAGLLLDFGFYLLNSDNIKQSVSIYREAYRLREEMFGSRINNLHTAIAEEDLAYALYVLEYSTGYFDEAMEHAQHAITTMNKILPEGNLILCSANRVKALILEEQALDMYHNSGEMKHEMLKEAEELHKGALALTKRTFGEENILTAKHYGNLGRLYQSMLKHKEAEEMHVKAIEIKERILGADDYEVGLSIGHLACLYNYHMKEYKKAEELYHRSININLKLFSESYSGLEYDYRGLINVYNQLGNDGLSLKFSNKLEKWANLRTECISDIVGTGLYKFITIVPLQNIIDTFEASTTSTTKICSSKQ